MFSDKTLSFNFIYANELTQKRLDVVLMPSYYPFILY